MRLFFGLNLDGYHAANAKPAFDEWICGPHGFLQLLETRLGLSSLPVSPFKRLLQFRRAVIETAEKHAVFFQASSRQDSLATARVLLQWRDGLIEAGWDGSATDKDPPRLRDMALLEDAVRTGVAPGDADRLAAVSQELNLRSPGEIRLEVGEDRAHLPWLWQKICDQLHANYGGDAPKPIGKPNTDLAYYQTGLVSQDAKKIKPNGDGSLLVLTAHSEITLARAVAQMIARRHDQDAITLIAGPQAGILDQALLAEDEPLLGLQLRSSARPIPQLLLLALRLCWQPVDPGALLEFLTHPVSPVGKILRRHLSEALAASPGIGGPAWNTAVAEAKAAISQLSDKDALQKMEEDLERWVLPQRFDPETGAPGARLSECCMHLSRWVAARSARLEEADVAGGHLKLLSSLATELAEVLADIPHISRLELEQLLMELCSGGWEGEVFETQLGHATCVHYPEAVREPAEQIIWWDFSEPAENRPLPWTKDEIQALGSHGACFLSPEAQAEIRIQSWLRPVMAARQQLILVLPKQRDGQPLSRHPLFARLLALTEGSPARLPLRDLDQELFFQKAEAPLEFATLAHRPLPAPRRWWKVADGKQLGARRRESYSSLDQFIYKPFAWVLNYSARLQRGPLTSLKLSPDFALKGTLLHRLLDLLLAEPAVKIHWQTCTRPELEQWCGQQWPLLLEQEGATLLLPGNLSQNLELLELAKRSLWELLRQLRSAGVTTAVTNVNPADAPFIGGSIMGFIDLLVTNQSGKVAVVDLKLGGGKVRAEELKFNRQLQLAVYGYLQNHQHKSWPAAAFYILSQQKMLTQSDIYFSQSTVQKTVAPQVGLENCWKEFEAVWRWRREQLDAGWIEVTTVEPAAPAEVGPPDSTPPVEHWRRQPGENNEYNDFVALTGWRADQ